MKILWMGNLIRTDVHNNQLNKPGYTQVRNRLWGIIYQDSVSLGRYAYTAQCEVGGVWELRKLTCYRPRHSWTDCCRTIRWKMSNHHFHSLIPNDVISSSRSLRYLDNAHEQHDWETALKEFNADASDRLRSSWMMHLLKTAHCEI